MSKLKHVRVLLLKDWLILRRNWFYIVMFTMLPVVMMSVFWYMTAVMDVHLSDEKHNFDYTKYSKIDVKADSFLGSEMSKMLRPRGNQGGNLTSMGQCVRQKRRDVGLIAPKLLTDNFAPFMHSEFNKHKLQLHIFDKVDDMMDDINYDRSRLYCFGFELTDIRPNTPEVNITVFFPRDSVSGLLNTQTPLYDLNSKNPDWAKYNSTMSFGTPHFMIQITDFIMMMMRGYKMNNLELAFIPMKTPEFKQLPPHAAEQLRNTFPFFFICIYLLPLYYMVTRLAEEKESKAREGMKMMGLKDSTYYSGWFILNALIVLWISGLIVSIIQLDLFFYSNAWLMLFMCTLYGTQLFGFSLTIVAILPSKKASATAASIMHLATYYVLHTYKGYSTSMIDKSIVAIFVPNVSLGFMLDHLLHCEITNGVGLTAETAWKPFQNFNFALGLICQFACVLLWAGVGIYLDKIMPREFGKAEPWNFICKRKQTFVNDLKIGEEQHDPRLVKLGNFEKEFLNQNESLKIRGLRKQFVNKTVAVDNESMTMNKGQIFALLGHNGAGKTTTISMLTGLLDPTSGVATVNGYNIFSNMDKFRESLGVCPQHNILFSELTVREHLEVFCAFKGTNTNFQIMRRVDKMISQLELEDVQFQLASTLSGGQKRKLSVGIALIGDAQIVMLDEPTSGMDTTTRRRFWNMIKLYKKDRIIILTTHYMDEADVLGDRICIMAEGKVQCCGTSLFLKNRFGVGYNLKLLKTDRTKTNDITKYINSKIPEAKLLQEVSSEITWQLPGSARSKFKSFFNSLDKDLYNLGLSSYGISITTLEEVFLSIGHGVDDQRGTTIEQIKAKTADLSKLSKRDKTLIDYSISDDMNKSFLNEFITMVWKKIILQIRDVKSCLMDILLPCVMIVGGIYISKMDLIPPGHAARNLSLYDFPNQRPLIRNNESFYSSSDEISRYIEKGFGSDIGEGKLWSNDDPFQTDKDLFFFEQLEQQDDYIFDSRNVSGPHFGSIYVQHVDNWAREYSVAGFFNASQPQAALSTSAYMLQSVMRDQLDNPSFKLNFLEAQLPFSLEWQIYIDTGVGLLSSIGFAIAFMMISDTLIQSLVKEKQNAIKHQIVISGGSKVAYWLSHYIVDVCSHAIPATLTCFCISYFEVNAPQVETIFMWFCLTNPLFIYSVQFFFQSDSIASVFIRVFYFAIGGIAPVTMQILLIMSTKTQKVQQYLTYYLRIVPVYSLNQGYISINSRASIEMLKKYDEGTLEPLDWECAGSSIFWIQVMMVVCVVFIVLVENNVFIILFRPYYKPVQTLLDLIHGSIQRKKQKKVYDIREVSSMEDADFNTKAYIQKIVDQDPKTEARRVRDVKDCAVKVQELTKAYTPFYTAVNNLSFALDYGECFALLGITGAGKTSTFKCLCQEEIPDSGQLEMAGHDVRSQFGFSSARSMIGYCPQFEAIYEQMTVKEHLEFYATIKGVRSDYLNELVTKQIRDMDLLQYTNIHAGKLSGGNKRKLSCAIALIGNPPIVLLDEPSTGVDPQAKRFMWTVISNISTLRKQSTVVLTTHSMEEAEALCPKMGIMVDGQFQCFGGAQHIKDKYSDGFEIDLNIKETSAQMLNQMLQKIGKNGDFMCDDRDVRNGLIKLGLQHIWDTRVTAENPLTRIFMQNPPYKLSDVLKWADTESKAATIKAKLTATFQQCGLIEHSNQRYLYKVARCNYSIGFVFGLIEEIKDELFIAEYSASQTTLEQIFNLLATQKGIGSRHESVDQEHAEKKNN